eukprot:2625771-Pleurochrysis_carterae.AAC.2
MAACKKNLSWHRMLGEHFSNTGLRRASKARACVFCHVPLWTRWFTELSCRLWLRLQAFARSAKALASVALTKAHAREIVANVGTREWQPLGWSGVRVGTREWQPLGWLGVRVVACARVRTCAVRVCACMRASICTDAHA